MKKLKEITDFLKRIHFIEFISYLIISDAAIYITMKYKLNTNLIQIINNSIIACIMMHTWYIEYKNISINLINIESIEEKYFKEMDKKYKEFLERIKK